LEAVAPPNGATEGSTAPAEDALLDEVEQKMLRLAHEITAYTEGQSSALDSSETALAREVRTKLDTILHLDTLPVRTVLASGPDYVAAVDFIRAALGQGDWTWGALLAWLFTHPLGKLVTDTDFAGQSRSWVDEWLLRKIIAGALHDLGADEGTAARGVLLVNALISQQDCLRAQVGETKPAYRVVEAWLKDDDVRGFLQVNRYQGVLWYNKESFDQLLGLMLLAGVVDAASRPAADLATVAEAIRSYHEVVRALRQAQAESDYRVDKLLAAAQGDLPARAAS